MKLQTLTTTNIDAAIATLITIIAGIPAKYPLLRDSLIKRQKALEWLADQEAPLVAFERFSISEDGGECYIYLKKCAKFGGKYCPYTDPHLLDLMYLKGSHHAAYGGGVVVT